MRVLVCGGRYYENPDVVHQELIRFHWQHSIDVIIHGGVAGAGAAAEAWARRNRVDVVRYPPNWEAWGKKAEALRNNFMLTDGRPDFVIAFPGGRDTADLVQKAALAGIQVLHVPALVGEKKISAEGNPHGESAVQRTCAHLATLLMFVALFG